MNRMIASLAVFGVLFAGCGDDDAPPPAGPDPVVSPFENLTQRDHVVANLEESYNRRDIEEYERLLDPDAFEFHFSDADYGSGRTPELWGREDDMAATGHMFDKNYQGDNRIVSITVKLDTENLEWSEFEPPGFPGETWHKAVVAYDYTIQAEPDFTWIVSGVPKAVFTVRNVGDDQNPKWRLVRWEDLGSGLAVGVAALGVSETTWGGIKALY